MMFLLLMSLSSDIVSADIDRPLLLLKQDYDYESDGDPSFTPPPPTDGR